MDADLFDRLSALFVYPTDGFAGRVEAACERVASCTPELAERLDPLSRHVVDNALEDLEEAYTRTFDINAACTLELGWHLFGEDYNRGAFLVEVRQLLRAHGVEESQELPDHLTHVLPLLARMPEDDARAFAHRFAMPAMDKMITGFEECENPYHPALVAVQDLLRAAFGVPEPTSGDEGVRTGPYSGIPGGMPTPCNAPLDFDAPMER